MIADFVACFLDADVRYLVVLGLIVFFHFSIFSLIILLFLWNILPQILAHLLKPARLNKPLNKWSKKT